MMKIVILVLAMLMFTGCRVSPLSPNLKNDIQNQEGKIDEIKNNQNGLMLELMKLKNQQELNARDVGNLQQGQFNKVNNGTQFFQGDGALITLLAGLGMSLAFIYHYRVIAIKNQKTAEIMAQQIAMSQNDDLENNVLMACMHTDVEDHVYHMIVKNQNAYRQFRQKSE